MGFYGDLTDFPLQDILYVISNHGKSGMLTLQTQSHDISLKFDCGTVASVMTSDGSLKIGQLLRSHGYVTEEQIEHALGLQSITPESTRIGDLLIEVGYVTREQIQDAVHAQLEASIFRILVQNGGTFSFEPSDDIVEDPITSGLRLESMVLNAMRMADEWGSAHDANLRVELTDEMINSSTVRDLDEHEQAVVMSVLNGECTLDVIALKSGLRSYEFTAAAESLADRGLIQLTTLSDAGQLAAEPAR